MVGLRRLIAWLGEPLARAAAWCASWAPYDPCRHQMPEYWRVVRGRPERCDTVVWVGFTPSSLARMRYHIVYLWRGPGCSQWIVVDGSTRGWLHALPLDTDPRKFLQRCGAEYTVEVWLQERHLLRYGDSPIRPLACTGIGLRLIGRQDRRAVAPVDLLVMLWRERDE